MTAAASMPAVGTTYSESRLKRWSAIGLFALLGCAVEGAALACADVASPRPPPVALKRIGDEPYEPLRGFDRALRLGIGHLRPARDEDRSDWLDFVLIPLAARPGDAPAVWLSAGWIVPSGGGTARRVGRRGALERGYETVSLIVLEMEEGGWLRIRFAPGDEASSTGWLHLCHLQRTRPQLVYEPWERLLAERTLSPLYFRTGGPRALRRGPEQSEEPLAWIPAEGRRYALEALEFKGDWMRARLTVPLDYCRHLNATPQVREGWVRWRDSHLGSLVWYHTRGC
jgi:hypothetical protein